MKIGQPSGVAGISLTDLLSAFALRLVHDFLLRLEGGQFQQAQEHPQGSLAHDVTFSGNRPS